MPTLYESFRLGYLPLVQEVFPSARLEVRHDAFVIPDAASAVRCSASALLDHVESRPSDARHRHELLTRIVPEIETIVAREGAFRAAKNAGCFVAEV